MRTVLALSLAVGACAQPAAEKPKLLLPESKAILSGRPLLDELKRGGFVLYFRHFHTDHTKWHVDPIQPKHGEMSVKDFRATCDQQRSLTAFGRRRATDAGALMKQLGIPIGEVFSSPYCRAVESATLLVGRVPDDTPYELVNGGGALTYEKMAKNVRPYLGRIPKPGTNTILVAHRTQMDDTRFIEEGECFVLEPLGEGKFNLVGTIYDSDWYEAAFNPDYLGLRGMQPAGDVVPRGVTK